MHFFPCDTVGLTHADDLVRGQCTGTHATFMSAAMHLRFQTDAGTPTDEKGSDTFRTANLVCGQCHQINFCFLQIDVHFACCLCGIEGTMKNVDGKYVFEYDGIHVRHYRILEDDHGSKGGRDLSGGISERELSDLLSDARETDGPGIKRTAVVVGRTDVEVAFWIMKQCDSLGLPCDTTRNLDRDGKMSLFFLNCSRLFEREKSLPGADDLSLRCFAIRVSKNSAIARSSSSDLGCTLDSEMSLSMQDGPDLIVT